MRRHSFLTYFSSYASLCVRLAFSNRIGRNFKIELLRLPTQRQSDRRWRLSLFDNRLYERTMLRL